ncbi:MAG: Mur ligase family protein [Thermoplasmata archaeon]|nr:Mur ligase family protein [Thermoplasmata archaeon]
MSEQNDYDEAVNWLYDLQYFGMKLGLANTRALLAELGNPHEKLKAVHVAGTNGKGSVCAFLTSILMDSGMKVGTYTSPHLRDFGERICINEFPMTRSEVLSSIKAIRPRVEAMAERDMQCTFFEVTTCMAFQYFARRKVDAAVIEVGMGGRLDSTNVLEPVLSIITTISKEHTQYLGETVKKIAGEKAGIIKKGVPVVSAVDEPGAMKVVESKAREMKSKLHNVCDVEIINSGLYGSTLSVNTSPNKYKNICIKLPGKHQAMNASTSILAAEILGQGIFPIKQENIIRGMERTRWNARLQVVRHNPDVIVDATHNPGGVQTLAIFLKKHFSHKPPILVLAMLIDKEVEPVVKALEPLVSEIIVTESSYNRRMKAADLAAMFKSEVEVIDSVSAAVDRAMSLAGKNGTVLVTGSIFTAAEALTHLDNLKLREMVHILSKSLGSGAYPGRDPGIAGPPPPGSQEPFRVLISTILSQRTKDENTHIATEALFAKYDNPKKLADAKPEDIEPLIKPAGFFKQKTRHIIQTSKELRDSYGSRVPDNIEELVSLPGVGRKTANCVLAYGFGIPAIAVDTHVHRISNLMGLVKTREPDDTEEVLERIVPVELWLDINRLMVRHGQTICAPMKPRCGECPISHLCDYGIYH